MFLYVAAHGYQRICGPCIEAGMQLPTLLRELKNAAHYSNIEGVVLGSCTVGSNVEEFMNTVKRLKIVGMFGYTCEIDWMTSTLIDLPVFEQMMGLEKSLLRNRQQILDRFARDLRRFDQDYPICTEGAVPVRLADSITLVIQPRGRGQEARGRHVHAPGTPGMVTGGRMSGIRHAGSVPAGFHRESPLKRGQ